MEKKCKEKVMVKVLWSLLIGVLLLGCTSIEGKAEQRFLTSDQRLVLDKMFHTHINYFLSPEIITSFGLPCTAYKVGNRARFGYSNPTEWGYAFQAWIAASERGIIPQHQAVTKLNTALATLNALQQDPEQSYQGLFYPFYKMTNPEGNDLLMPYHDPYPEIPSGDNALLYASLLIVEGWAIRIGNDNLANQARTVRKCMSFRMFLRNRLYLAHTINANTCQLSGSNWDIFADEGGVVTWVAYFSGSVSFEEFQRLTESQWRTSANWLSCQDEPYEVKEAAWFNAMFTWGVRSLAGFPIGSFDAPPGIDSSYSRDSFVPTIQAHLAFGDCLGIDYPLFSDAMSQAENGRGLVGWIQGWYMPPNIPRKKMRQPPRHVVPHALFVPFNAGPDLPLETINHLVELIEKLRSDRAGYWHDNDSDLYPFGFEVIASPYKDNLEYDGADDGRNIFETLSESYTVLSLFNVLQLNDNRPTFCKMAMAVSEYENKIREVLQHLYP